MNKKAVVETFTVVAVVAIVSSLIASSYIIMTTSSVINSNIETSGTVRNIKEISKPNYVGNLDTKNFYSLECNIYIEEEKRVFFRSFDDAIHLGFKYTSCKNGQ